MKRVNLVGNVKALATAHGRGVGKGDERRGGRAREGRVREGGRKEKEESGGERWWKRLVGGEE